MIDILCLGGCPRTAIFSKIEDCPKIKIARKIKMPGKTWIQLALQDTVRNENINKQKSKI
jgi:hypothetical protein